MHSMKIDDVEGIEDLTRYDSENPNVPISAHHQHHTPLHSHLLHNHAVILSELLSLCTKIIVL